MIANSLQSNQRDEHFLDSDKKHLNLEIEQEKLYSFLLEIVKTRKLEDVLQEFKRLFIDPFEDEDLVNDNSLKGVYGIFVAHNEQEFRNTLKRCCYIIINNWEANRKHEYIQELLNLLDEFYHTVKLNSSIPENRYRGWLINFFNSNDYQEIKFFGDKYEEPVKQPWTKRYTSYLLFAQSLDEGQTKEQQNAARKRYKQLKEKYKFELAMYIAHSESRTASAKRYKNPSILGDQVLRLIKMIVVKKGVFSYENIANIFIKQIENQTFKDFKESIQKYLFFSVQHEKIVDPLRQQLSEKLSSWLVEYNGRIVDKDLLLRASNKIIDYLTTENGQEPALLFTLLLSQGHALTLVVVLLKIILISRNSRSHLEVRIAHLIRYYDKYAADECRWIINFIEIFNITFAIYADNIVYNLIKVKKDEQPCDLQLESDAYRVFSQSKI